MAINKQLEVCIDAALAGGNAIINYTHKTVTTKGDKVVGDHAIVTDADYKSQKAILKSINSKNIFALLITEEHVTDKKFLDRLINPDSLHKMLDNDVYIIDELDGTSSFDRGHYEWSISVGEVKNLVHINGAIYAPKIEGGTVYAASKNQGAFMLQHHKQTKIQVSNTTDIHKAYVIFGPDSFLKKYHVHNKLLSELGDVARTTNAFGSSALALGLVASGVVDAMVAPLQSPWDWAAGKLIVEEAGGIMLFYEMQNGIVNFVDKPDLKHYIPTERALGIIAGNKKVSYDIKSILENINY
jgi:fructose-1,6-bisphosphatase/inositol monophosphatase family enzyme